MTLFLRMGMTQVDSHAHLNQHLSHALHTLALISTSEHITCTTQPNNNYAVHHHTSPEKRCTPENHAIVSWMLCLFSCKHFRSPPLVFFHMTNDVPT